MVVQIVTATRIQTCSHSRADLLVNSNHQPGTRSAWPSSCI